MLNRLDKDTRETIEATVGRRGTALMVWVVWAAVIAVGLLAIGTFVLQASRHVVQPYILPLFLNVAVPTPTPVMLSTLIATSVVLIIAAVLTRRVLAWKNVFLLAIENYVHGQTAPIRESLDQIEENYKTLAARVDALDDFTDLRPSPIRKLLTERLLIEMKGPLIIHSAQYGVGKTAEQSVDVTAVLVGYIKDNHIDILVNNDTLGCHPYAGKPKTLFVEYSGEGHVHKSIEVPETHKLVIPEPKTIGMLAGIR